jgi:hypothetical protein
MKNFTHRISLKKISSMKYQSLGKGGDKSLEFIPMNNVSMNVG